MTLAFNPNALLLRAGPRNQQNLRSRGIAGRPVSMKQTTARLLTVLSAALVATQLHAATLITKFATDPLTAGWQVYGDTNLFTWDSVNENLAVTWDSSQTNSYFHYPLGTTLTRSNGFLLAFDLTITNMPVIGGFPIAVGLLNITNATATNFLRGTGADSPNLAEFDYYLDPFFGPSIDGTIADSANQFTFAYGNDPLDFGTTYRVVLTHLPGAALLTGQILTNGQSYKRLLSSFASTNFTDFQLNTLAVPSYSDVNGYGLSVLAHGTVDNLILASPLPVETLTALAPGEVSFASDTNWVYTLEASTNLLSWSAAAPTTPGNGTNLVLQATNAPVDAAFFRVRADLP